MSTFTKCAAPATTGSCDPTRHVNYNLGMVMGVDDFNQEFSYLSGRDQWMARDLTGYGTVSGLRVVTEVDAKGPRVVVSPGVAVSPCGQMIRVPTAQCAYLDDWLNLDTTKAELISRAGSPPTTLRAYVVLCYRDCPTDDVPIPGEPCRSEDDLMAPSRLADDFTLELRFEPPSQTEEDAVRRFVGWLHAVGVTDVPTDATPLKDLLGALRLAHSRPDPAIAIQPILPATFKIPANQLCSYLHAAFHLWVTELRPQWRPDLFSSGHGCCGHSQSADVPQEECVLLAEVDVPVLIPNDAGVWQVDDHAEIVNEDSRPYLINLRMLQEWLLCGPNQNAASAGAGAPNAARDVTGPRTDTAVARIAVEHPPELPQYSVVAAGLVSCGSPGERIPGVYNGLKVSGVAEAQVNVTFNGYKTPQESLLHKYIVKVLPVVTAKLPKLAIYFDGFGAEGFFLRVLNDGARVSQRDIKKLQLMIEVSQYTAPILTQ